jgi:beta-glucosidase
MTALRFPPGFVWGTATAAYQIEGAATTDGRAPSIWDEYLKTHGYRGDTGEVAANHYRYWESDLDLLAKLGAPNYRFSVSWSRVMPDGRTTNQRGLDFYRRLIDGLLSRGIEPSLTMYHMDLPAVFAGIGGWASRETAQRFADFAHTLVTEFGGLVSRWMTVNEPYYESWMGYGEGAFPPGLKEPSRAVAALHHMLLAHGWAVGLVRELAPGSAVGPVLGYAPTMAATDHRDDRWAAKTAHIHVNGAVLDPILRGAYPVDYAEHPRRVDAIRAVVHDGDMDAISQRPDFIGLNYYFPRYVAAAGRVGHADVAAVMDPPSDWLHLTHLADVGVCELRPKRPWRTLAGWAPEPEGLTQALLEVTDAYGDIPLLVTENGLPLADYVDPSGRVNDIERSLYLQEHLTAVHQALELGCPVEGYFVWSALDNLEWTAGFQHRFGLIFVDFATGRRTPKASFDWFADVVRTNSLPHPPTKHQKDADQASALEGELL